MPTFAKNIPAYRPGREIEFNWNTFRRGLDTLLQPNEINNDEVVQAENIMLVGRGIPTKRWGTSLYHQAGNATGSVRGLKGFYKSNGTVELLALTDDGYLTTRSGASYTQLSGVSWASGTSGSQAYMAQIEDSTYIVNGARELVRYSNPTLVGFPTIAVPSGLGASNTSNATGATTKAYKVSAVSQVGETIASTAISLPTQPQTLGGAGGRIRLTWGTVSTASGILQGYNIYGRDLGYERFLGAVDASSTIFIDDGVAIPKEFTFPPTADSTGGPLAKYVKRFQDRLVFGGLNGEPSKVLISGKAPNHEKFDLSYGGNYIKIEPDAGDDIIQIEPFADRIIVWKERSIWQVTLGTEQIGNFFVTTPTLKLITASHGCVAPRSVVPVGNDVFFLSRRGVFSLGYESGFAFDVLRSNEISVKVRPFFESLTVSQKQNAVAAFHDNKYIIAFPGKDQMLVFDRERLAWYGPWTLDATVFETFYDADNNEHLLFAQEGTVNVDEFSKSFIDDKGAAIQTVLRTKTEDFGDWSLFKTIRNVFLQFQNVTGDVGADIRLEQRSGSVVTAKSFTITPNTGNSGWGADVWGTALWGSSLVAGGGTDAQQTIRWRELNKAARTMQMTIKTTDRNANYELLGIRGNAKPIGSGYRPSSWKT